MGSRAIGADMHGSPWNDVLYFMIFGLGINVFMHCVGYLAGQFSQWMREVAR